MPSRWSCSRPGRKPAGNEAAQTHSGTIVGSDDVFDAALRRAGAVRVRSFVELFSAAKCLASRYRPVGRAAGHRHQRRRPGRAGGGLGQRDRPAARQAVARRASTRCSRSCRALASLTDLIDLSEDADAGALPGRDRRSLGRPQIDGVLAIFSPKAGVDAAAAARALADIPRPMSKPLLACWMGDASVGAARAMLLAGAPSRLSARPRRRSAPSATSRPSTRTSCCCSRRRRRSSTLAKPDIEGARLLIESVLAERRKVLTEMESKSLLSAFHIPITRTLLARSANEAHDDRDASWAFRSRSRSIRPTSATSPTSRACALNVMNGAGARDAYHDMMERVARLAPEARINGVTRAEDGAGRGAAARSMSAW